MPEDHCSSSPCENGGTCVNTADNNYICVCRTQWTGTNCETGEYRLFLITDIKANFRYYKISSITFYPQFRDQPLLKFSVWKWRYMRQHFGWQLHLCLQNPVDWNHLWRWFVSILFFWLKIYHQLIWYLYKSKKHSEGITINSSQNFWTATFLPLEIKPWTCINTSNRNCVWNQQLQFCWR